jgi:general secretion pathway protein D
MIMTNENTTCIAKAAVIAWAIAGLVGVAPALGQQANGATDPPAVTNGTAAKAPAAKGSSRKGSGLRASTPVTINFVNAEIEAVTRAMGAMLDRQFIVDPRVKGQVTVYSEQAIPVSQAYLNFLAALRGLGYTVVESGGLLKVVPEADAKLQTGTVEVAGRGYRGDQVLTQVFRLSHENPNNLVPVLRPLISPNNTINANVATQSLVITDYADNLSRLGKIIAALDNPSSTDLEIFTLKYAVALDLAPLVQRLADGTGGGGTAVPAAGAPGAQGAVGGQASGISVLADARSNSLIVRANSAAKLMHTRSIIERLDRAPQGSGAVGNIWVVYLKNADAVRLATVLRAAFTNPNQQQQGGGATGGGAQPTTTPAPSVNTSAGGSGSGSTIATQPLQGAAGVQTGGFIQADPATNSLIITAPEPLYRQVRAVIDQLDSRRAQVVVESMIVKIDANKALDLGVQWQGILGNNGDRTLLGAGTNFGTGGNNIVSQGLGVARAVDANGNVVPANITGGQGSLSIPGAGLNLGLIRRFGNIYTLASLARFLESQAGANVLSTPTIVALDNEEAQIVIGQNVPFITGQFASTSVGTSAINPFQTIERKDVGLTLRVKPQIGEGGTIRMNIYQENSAVVPGATTNAGPTTDKSAIATSVVVEDGQVMVLGGLLKDEFADGDDKIPGLGDVPIAGNLFKSQNRRRVKSNLMVFLRPVVMRDAQAVDSVTLDRYESIRSQQRNFSPNPGVGESHDGPLLPPIQAPNVVPPGTAPPRAPAPASTSPSGALQPPATSPEPAGQDKKGGEPERAAVGDASRVTGRREIGIAVP